MEFTKDNVFEVRYDTNLDRLVLKKEKKVNRIVNKMKRHKLITTASIAFVMFSVLNTFMIYYFMKILQNF